ncbi:threonine dehydratase [Roseospirillum parvum]|uniref:Threonine dehydratase n=1 Tax=Roseospirillum parvum TaxID=83401 RepID=A0A1G8E3N5_9PROT|nr:threonine dehydratase [Roseospirillum parvum]SDH64451.1 threonine dehydratase [Roseospirillum parvum]
MLLNAEFASPAGDPLAGLPDLAALKAASDLVRRHMLPTPTLNWPLLDRRIGAEVWVKHENHTPIGAFKVRGGLVYLSRLRQARPEVGGVISATRGNHGQSLALAGRTVGLSVVIVVPEGNNPEKNAAMVALGAELVVHGRDFQEAAEHAAELAEARHLHMVPPFHPWLVEGVATYGLELFSAHPDLEAVFVPIGMGSGICGLITAARALGVEIPIIGVVSQGAPAYHLSFRAGRVIATERAETVADGLACRTPSPQALDIIRAGATDVVTVADSSIRAAMAAYVTDTHNLAEGAGAAPLAALIEANGLYRGRKVGVVLSGGNVDRILLSEILAAEE